MMDKMGEITVGVLGILTIATKETVVRRGSKPVLRLTSLEADLWFRNIFEESSWTDGSGG